jgi:hypothetical protein
MAAAEQRQTTELEAEFHYYLEHQDELVAKYNGKHLVIKGATILGAYDTVADAYLAASKEHEPGTFLIQRCSPGDDDYTNTYHSRVCFAL